EPKIDATNVAVFRERGTKARAIVAARDETSGNCFGAAFGIRSSFVICPSCFVISQRLRSLGVLLPAEFVGSLTLAGPASSLRAMSKLPFELMLALRYLRPRRTFVSVITLISIIGVMLGVAVLIIVISVMSGFDRQLRDRILGFNAHL